MLISWTSIWFIYTILKKKSYNADNLCAYQHFLLFDIYMNDSLMSDLLTPINILARETKLYRHHHIEKIQKQAITTPKHVQSLKTMPRVGQWVFCSILAPHWFQFEDYASVKRHILKLRLPQLADIELSLLSKQKHHAQNSPLVIPYHQLH